MRILIISTRANILFAIVALSKTDLCEHIVEPPKLTLRPMVKAYPNKKERQSWPKQNKAPKSGKEPSSRGVKFNARAPWRRH